MKNKVSQKEIVYQYATYDIVIPNNNRIEYYFYNNLSEALGTLLPFVIKSKDQKIISKYWIIGYVSYCLTILYNFIIQFLSPEISNTFGLKYIFGEKQIRDFLTELKKFNYFEIDKQINKLNEIVSQEKINTLIPGSKEYKNDKFKLILLAFAIFAVPAVLGLLIYGGKSKADIVQLSAVLIFVLIICLVIYKALNKTKK
jgi:hypothetical protein